MGSSFRQDQGWAEVMVNGENITGLVHQVAVNYSMLNKIPGAYSMIRLLDTTGMANRAKAALYEPMVPVRIIYSDAMRSNVQEIETVAAGLAGGKGTQSLRGTVQDLMTATSSFFNAQQLIQQASKGEPAGALIQKIHSLFIDPQNGLRVVGTKILAEKEHYLISNRAAGDAVADIRKRAVTTDKYKSNSLLYFRDLTNGYVLTSLEELFDGAMSPAIKISRTGSDGVSNLGNEASLAYNSVKFKINQDNAARYWKATSQSGGSPGKKLFDNHSCEYRPESAQQYDPSSTYSSRLTKPYGGTASQLPMITHSPIYDETLTGPAPPNVDKAQAALQQAAAGGAPLATVNLSSLEPRLNVGKGVYLDIPAPAPGNPGAAPPASTRGHFLIVSMGHYITMGSTNSPVTNSFEAIQTGREA